MSSNKNYIKLKSIAILLIFIWGFIIYFNSFNNKFLWDDISLIVNNAAIKSFTNIPAVFKHDLTYFGGEEDETFFRPTQAISYMADYFLWGLNPFGYHLTSTLTHIAVCSLLFLLISYITKEMLFSLIASLLYLVHPIHVEAVTYVAGRADLLSSLFFIIMLILQYKYWVHSEKNKKILYYSLLLPVFLLALLSKEYAMIFPFLMMIYECCLRDRRRYTGLINKRLLFYIPFFIIIAIWYLYKNSVVSTTPLLEEISPLKTRLLIAPKLMCDYVRLSLLPVNLHMEYKIPFPKSWLQADYFWPIIFFAVFLYLARYLWKRGMADINYRVMFFGISWFLVGLFPYSHIPFIVNAPLAEHWLYIPEMGFVIFIVYCGFYYSRKTRLSKKIFGVLCISIIILFSSLTIKQNTVWKNGLTLYSHIIKYSRSSDKAYNNLGVEYLRRGDAVKAKELFQKALKINPTYEPAIKNLERFK
jgi:protein O-mannosyl-transferase